MHLDTFQITHVHVCVFIKWGSVETCVVCVDDNEAHSLLKKKKKHEKKETKDQRT